MYLTIAICGNYMINNYACLTCPLLPRSQFFVLFLVAKYFQHILKFPSLLSHSSLSLALLSVFSGQETTPPFFCTIQTHSQNLLLYPASLNCLEQFKTGVLKCHSRPPWSTLQIGSFVLRTKEIVPQLQFREKCIKTKPIWN